jgi:hypothetical protein
MAAPRPAVDDPVVIARRYWEELQEERLRCGMSLRRLANELRRHCPTEGPAHTTLKDWFATRKSLPHKPLFLALVRVLELDERHWDSEWERWHRARQTPAPLEQAAPNELPSWPESLGPPPSTWRRLIPRSVSVLAMGTVVALALLAVAVSQARDSPAGQPDMAQLTPDAPDLAFDRALPLPSARPARLGSPAGSATAANSAAHVDFHRDSNLFRLYDDRSDGRSAILELKIDGVVAEPVYNSRGKTDAAHPAKEVPRPSVGSDSSIEFRVCVGEYGDPVPERTCGAWTSEPG